jgi:DNA repair protein RecO (recombination protein O)
MEWVDEGIVLGVRRHGEGAAIVELMTPTHGRHLGLVRGGSGSRLRPVLQPGNRVSATWRARLDEHLGHYQVEGIDLTAASLFAAGYAVYGVTHLGALCRLLPERDPHPEIYAALDEVLGCMLDAQLAGAQVIRFEMALLGELGFGLDLSQCAVTGGSDDLCFVSPRTGRAVSREAGRPWQERLLRLPAFLNGSEDAPTHEDLAAGFKLAGFFLVRHVLEPRGLAFADARASFIAAVLRVGPGAVALR